MKLCLPQKFICVRYLTSLSSLEFLVTSWTAIPLLQIGWVPSSEPGSLQFFLDAPSHTGTIVHQHNQDWPTRTQNKIHSYMYLLHFLNNKGNYWWSDSSTVKRLYLAGRTCIFREFRKLAFICEMNYSENYFTAMCRRLSEAISSGEMSGLVCQDTGQNRTISTTWGK